jgi:aspartate aminotransferase
MPEGAFYAFPSVLGLSLSSAEFCEKLLKEGNVAAVPGSAFGAEGYVRFSYATPEARLRDGIARIRKFAGGLK